MDQELMEWLNMVWGALDEQDADKRQNLLHHANTFLEQTREYTQEAMAGK